MMYKADYHIHCNYSTDSSVEMEDMILSAIKKGFDEIAITDHVDVVYPPVSYDPGGKFDFGEYDEKRNFLKQKYKDKINIVLGLEMGLQPRFKKETDDYMKGKPFDFVIGSLHCVDFQDLYESEYFTGKSKKAAYSEYFEEVYCAVKTFDFFDVFGHIDFICRYGRYSDSSLAYADYSGIMDDVFKLIIEKGKGIELNTSGYRYGVGGPHPKPDFLKRYKQLGGEIITIGSDAHYAEDIGSNFDNAYKLIKDAGFKAIALYRDRKPVFVDL